MRFFSLLVFAACAPAAAPPSAAVLAPAGSAETSPTSTATGVVPAAHCSERHAIAQAEFEATFGDGDQAMRLARIVPVPRDGGTVIQLHGIMTDGVLARWGLRNGDEVVTLNGFAVSAPDVALEAYADARHRTDHELAIVRDGQPLTLCYHLER